MLLPIVCTLFTYAAYRLYRYIYLAPDVDPQGKYVLISGCDTGFGHLLAIALDRQGFHVFAGVYSADSEATLATELSPRATVLLLDITREQDIRAAYEKVRAQTSTLHALVNNAGVATGGHIDWISVETMRQVMNINYFGHVSMTKTFLPLLIAKRDSRVVNVSSMYGFLSPPGGSAYSASKYALEAFSDSLRREMFAWGLRVNLIEPGNMRTPLLPKAAHAVRELALKLPLDVRQRWGTEFFMRYYEQSKISPLTNWAEDPIKVVQALQHAVASSTPAIRYRPGWQSKFFALPLSMIPTWLADYYFTGICSVGVLPAGVHKQLKP